MSLDIPKYVELVNQYIEKGYTDGLPIIPPYPDAIREMIAAVGRRPDEVLGQVPPSNRPLTVETVAINAVMAGCLPEYMPVVMAALEGMLDPSFQWLGVAISTKGPAPLIIVNGPIRHKLGINCKGNLFGPGNRANATISRAIRLIMMNVGGAVKGVDKATFGHPGRYSYVIGEDEENSPWPPFHVEHGFDPEDSTVSVIACEGPKQIHMHNVDNGAEGILYTLADAFITLGSYNATGKDTGVFIIGHEHRQTLAQEGWDKEKIKEYLYNHCCRKAGEIRRTVGNSEVKWVRDEDEDDKLIHIFNHPDQIKIISAGGEAGKYSVVIDGFSGFSKWQIRKINLKSQ